MLYDACFILLQSIAHDARTLNMARTLVGRGKSVLLLGIGTTAEKNLLEQEGLDFYPVLAPPVKQKLALRWIDFFRAIYKLRKAAKARTYWAEDVFSLPMAFFLAKRYRAKVIYDSREIFSALGSLVNSPKKQKIVSRIERFYAPKAASIFTSGDLDSGYLAELLPIPRPQVVMNVPPFNLTKRTNLLRQKFSIDSSKKIILYQGMIAEGRGILKCVEALEFLPDCVLCLVGDGEFSVQVHEQALKTGVINKVFFCEKIPYDELPKWTASADVGMCFIEPISLSYSFALPNKLFEYCMAGIPSVVSDLEAMRRVLNEFPIGVCRENDATPLEIAGAIKEVLSQEFQTEFNQIKLRAAKNYCWENQEEIIMTMFNNAVKK
ncbi:MAG: glycosyltransferase [Ignavibacteriae bacterium]|nr:glycosyltransferase [Ignavibacteriota bacterium]